jgi:hypothetical protein
MSKYESQLNFYQKDIMTRGCEKYVRAKMFVFKRVSKRKNLQLSIKMNALSSCVVKIEKEI